MLSTNKGAGEKADVGLLELALGEARMALALAANWSTGFNPATIPGASIPNPFSATTATCAAFAAITPLRTGSFRVRAYVMSGPATAAGSFTIFVGQGVLAAPSIGNTTGASLPAVLSGGSIPTGPACSAGSSAFEGMEIYTGFPAGHQGSSVSNLGTLAIGTATNFATMVGQSGNQFSIPATGAFVEAQEVGQGQGTP